MNDSEISAGTIGYLRELFRKHAARHHSEGRAGHSKTKGKSEMNRTTKRDRKIDRKTEDRTREKQFKKRKSQSNRID